ncbi:MAG: hypothetical protein MUD01_26050 [Chloroflexaceae bacterium]|jgi:NADH:ubiquinone oxidoreductase subunit E|nr:hypothetical protein [Chloroflexaceae bacterium]
MRHQLRLTLCGLCTQSRPEITYTVNRLLKEYPDELKVVALDCIAACDDVPAVMIEMDYLPRVTPQELYTAVCERLVEA